MRGATNISRIDRARAFAPSQSYSLTTIETALYYETGDNRFVVSICADVGGAPGAVLSSFTQPATAAPPFQTALYTAPYSGITLSAGTTYWIVVGAINPTTGNGGFWLASSPVNTGFASFIDGSWSPESGPAPVFRVSGTLAAPEPSALALLGLTLPLLLRKRKR